LLFSEYNFQIKPNLEKPEKKKSKGKRSKSKTLMQAVKNSVRIVLKVKMKCEFIWSSIFEASAGSARRFCILKFRQALLIAFAF